MSGAKRRFESYLPVLRGRGALCCLIAVSFTESIFFPIPPDVLLMLMCLAQRQLAWRLATVCTLSSVTGGILGYLIGHLWFRSICGPIISFYHYGKALDALEGLYFSYGPIVFFAKLFLPFPYKFVAFASGQISLNPLAFVFISLVIRGYRFFVLAGLTNLFGPLMLALLERRPILILSILTFLPLSISLILRYVLRL